MLNDQAETGSGWSFGGARDDDRLPAVMGADRRFTLAGAFIVLGVALGMLLILRTSSSLLIIFAGGLSASFLDACARALGFVPVGRAWRLTLVILILASLVVLGGIWGVGKVPEQTSILTRVIDTQLDILPHRLLSVGVELFGPDGARDLSRWFPDHDKLFGHAQTAVGIVASVFANTLVIVFLGLLFAFDLAAYRDGVLLLARPSSRDRLRAVLDEMGSVLRSWLVGQLIRIVIMTLCVWLALYLLGLPGAFLLGLQAGLSNFVPYLGPILATGRISRYAPRPLDADLGSRYLYRHTINRGLCDRSSDPAAGCRAAPAWTLVSIVLFGVMGIALAMPLLAIGRVAVLRLYVEDWLGDDLGSPDRK